MIWWGSSFGVGSIMRELVVTGCQRGLFLSTAGFTLTAVSVVRNLALAAPSYSWELCWCLMLCLADIQRVDYIPCRQATNLRTCSSFSLSSFIIFLLIYAPSQVTAWLSGVLSAPRMPTAAPPPGGLSAGVDSTIAATALARHLIRRVPFEAKPVLLAMQEAAELAAAGGGELVSGASSSRRRSGKRKHVSGSGKGSGPSPAAGLAAVAPLLKAARAAVQTPLLPLPVPVSPAPSSSEGSESGGTPSARALSLSLLDDDDDDDDGLKDSTTGEQGAAADASPASVTAEMLLSSFVRSPAAVRRSIREAMQQG